MSYQKTAVQSGGRASTGARSQGTRKLFLNLRSIFLQRSLCVVVTLRRAFDYAWLLPSQIVLELTEHEPVPDADALLRVLDLLFDEGMKLSLDDVAASPTKRSRNESHYVSATTHRTRQSSAILVACVAGRTHRSLRGGFHRFLSQPLCLCREQIVLRRAL